jgi:P27 family predicted phage terminase small subunit
MRGRKPKLDTVVHFPGAEESEEFHRRRAIELRPKGLTRAQRQEWLRIAVELSKVGRLKPLFVDLIADYVYLLLKVAGTRKQLDDEGWTYGSETRDGHQMKNKPEVGQYNDDWRKLYVLAARLGLSPADEQRLRNNRQGDLFGDGNEFDQLDKLSG